MNKTLKDNGLSKLMNQPETIDGYAIEGDLEFLGRDFFNDILIKNCVFKELLSLKKCRFFKSLTFENCEFEKGICFSECEVIGAFVLKSSQLDSEAIFQDCTFSSYLSEDTKFYKALFCGYLKNNSIKSEEITFISSFFNKLSFNDLECYKPLRLKDIHLDTLEICRSCINSPISLGYFKDSLNLFVKDIFFESSKFKQRIDFYDGNIEKTIYIHKVEFDEQVVFNRHISFKNIWLAEVRSKYTFSLNFQDNFEHVNLSDCFFETSFSIYNFEKQDKYSRQVTIDFDGVINGNYIIKQIPILSLNLSCINFGNIIFENVETKFIIFSQFYNFNRNSKVFINSIRYNPDYNILVITDSNLGNTEFGNIDFRKFEEIVIYKSEISNMLLTNSIFPKKIQIASKAPQLGYSVPLPEKINDNIYYRDSYRQLKLAMEKMSNRYYSLIYKSKEMYYQRKELGWNWDKVLLYINYLSNNNGISWIRAIFFTLGCALIAFLCLNSQLQEPLFYWTTNSNFKETMETFRFGAKNYISYLSTYPVLKIENLKDNWIVDLIVLLSRIFISIGVYQIITAFRKYGK